MNTVITNFGKINGQRIITFKKPVGDAGGAKAFRRWKIARKAWRSRKFGRQLPLPL